MVDRHCAGCGNARIEPSKRQWWWCNKYFGFTGFFCPDCYDKISHDSYKNPNNPAEYLMMLLKLTGVKQHAEH